MKTKRKVIILLLFLIICILVSLIFINKSEDTYSKDVKSVPILTYHNFMSKEEKKKYASDDKYTISTESFEKQLKYLKEHGYRTISLDDFYMWYTNQIELTEKDVVIVIDDGNVSQYHYAIPLLEKYDFGATIFVVTGRIKNENIEYDPSNNQYFSQNIINDIQNNHKNIKLESHTHNLHQLIDGEIAIKQKPDEEVENDLKVSKDILGAEYMAYPYGWNTATSTEILKKLGYKMAFAFGQGNYGRASRSDEQYYIKRVNINAETTMSDFVKYLEEK